MTTVTPAPRVTSEAFEGENSGPAFWDTPPGSRSYRVHLAFEDRTISVDFHCGPLAGYPETSDVLSCLLSDMSSLNCVSGATEFGREFGYEVDSWEDVAKVEKIYNATKANAAKVTYLLGDHLMDVVDAYVEDELGQFCGE